MSQNGAVVRHLYGKPRQYADTAAALRLVGKRDEIHPRDAVAWVYPSQEAADAFAKVNTEEHGHVTCHTHVEGVGVLGVVDLRRQLKRLGGAVTDPALPDDWQPRRTGT